MSKFRESKFLNESGTKRGNWYMNRLDFFEFHEYPKYKKHKLVSLVIFIVSIFTIIEILPNSFLLALPVIYICYISLRTFDVLRAKACKYRGYFLYPKRFVAFFEARKVEINLKDFDSVATLNDK